MQQYFRLESQLLTVLVQNDLLVTKEETGKTVRKHVGKRRNEGQFKKLK